MDNDNDSDDIAAINARYQLPRFPVLDETWKQQAACRGLDTRLFFPGQGDTYTARHALSVCSTCPVAEECLAYAEASGVRTGIWGGQSERARRNTRSRLYGRQPDQVTHGTEGGYAQHMRNETEPCAECRKAHNLAQQIRRERRRSA